MIPKHTEVRFEPTTVCNYDCVICARRFTDRTLRTMTQKEFCRYFDKIMEETDQYTSMSFAGTGDPLCDKGLEDKVKYALKRKQMEVPIVTNGYLLTPRRFRSLQDAGVTTIRVSFHGGTPEAYEKVHRRNGFYAVRENIASALRNKTTTNITVCMVVVPENEDTIYDWLKLWDDERISLKEVWRAHNWVGQHHYRELQEETMTTCGRVFHGPLQVQVDGTVNMCCMDFHGDLLLGDLKSQSLKEIFDSPFYRKLTRCHKSGVFDKDLLCGTCEQRNANKEEACIYSSKYNDIKDRVKRVSTTHVKFL